MRQFIYFIQAGKAIKIGFTTNLMDRFMVIQTSNAEKLKLIAVIEGSPEGESELHKMFKKYNIRGEWFWPSEELLEFVDSLPKTIVENFNKSFDEPCRCGSKVMHMKEEDGKFVGYCRGCLMIKDGRMDRLIEITRRPRSIKENGICVVCNNDKEKYLRHGRCAACSAYFKRKGHDRGEELINRPLQCENCSAPQRRLTKRLCRKCYYFQHTHGFPRPQKETQ